MLDGRKNSKPRVREILENGDDWAREQSAATTAQPKRMSAGHPQRPAVRPAHEV